MTSMTAPLHEASRTVLIALIPGIAVMLWYFGFGALRNIALALLFSFALEAIALCFHRRSLRKLSHAGVAITALIFAIALPAGAGAWLLALGCATMVLTRHAWGTTNRSPFNPAMVGYALLLVLFPALFAQWPTPGHFDGITGATTLDVFRHNEAQLVEVWWQMHPLQFGTLGGYGWEWINAGFLLGGVWLLYRKAICWRIPVALLATLGICAAVFYDDGSSASGGSPLFHWFSGATMIGAFFIATEPATVPRESRARLMQGALLGALIFAIRHAGGYPDGVAFAILIGNALAPLLDRIVAAMPSLPTREACDAD